MKEHLDSFQSDAHDLVVDGAVDGSTEPEFKHPAGHAQVLDDGAHMDGLSSVEPHELDGSFYQFVFYGQDVGGLPDGDMGGLDENSPGPRCEQPGRFGKCLQPLGKPLLL
jgi:hypothetical protein